MHEGLTTGNPSHTEDTSRKQEELLQLQTNAPEKENNKDFSRTWEPIEDTPFAYVRTEEGKEFLAMGNKRVTEYKTKDELMCMIGGRDWNLILNAVVVILADIQKIDLSE